MKRSGVPAPDRLLFPCPDRASNCAAREITKTVSTTAVDAAEALLLIVTMKGTPIERRCIGMRQPLVRQIALVGIIATPLPHCRPAAGDPPLRFSVICLHRDSSGASARLVNGLGRRRHPALTEHPPDHPQHVEQNDPEQQGKEQRQIAVDALIQNQLRCHRRPFR